MKHDNTLDNLFEIVDEHDIYLFAKNYAYMNEPFAEMLIKRFRKQLPSADKVPTLAELKKAIDQCFSHYIKQPSYNRYQNWDPELLDWDKVSRDIQRINRQLVMLTENGHAELAVDAAILLLESGGENYEQEWNCDVEVDYDNLHADDTFSIIRDIFENDRISNRKKLDICKKLGRLDQHSSFGDIDFSDIINETREQLLTDDDRIALRREEFEKASHEYERENAAEELWDYLIRLGRSEEAVRFFGENPQLSHLRRKYIDWQIAQGKLQEALKAIDEGLVMHKQYVGTVYDLDRTKLAILERMNDMPAVILQVKKLFIGNNSDTMTYYHQLKRLIPPTEWPDELRALVRRKDFGRCAVSHLAEIYEKEKWYDELFQLMKDSRTGLLTGLSLYARHFDTARQQILVNRLESVFRDMAKHTQPRQQYKELADKLSILRSSCAPGAELASKLVAEFRIKYKNRPAMIDELKGH